MDRISKLARPLATALVLVCLAVGCGKDEGGTPEPPSPPDPPKPAETVIETFKKTTTPGAYDLSGDALKAIVSYVEGENQYSFFEDANGFLSSVTDMDRGIAFRAELSATMVVVDQSYTVTVTSVGSDALASVKGKDKKLSCIKAATAIYWLVDDENKIGFILTRKQL